MKKLTSLLMTITLLVLINGLAIGYPKINAISTGSVYVAGDNYLQVVWSGATIPTGNTGGIQLDVSNILDWDGFFFTVNGSASDGVATISTGSMQWEHPDGDASTVSIVQDMGQINTVTSFLSDRLDLRFYKQSPTTSVIATVDVRLWND